MYIPIYLVSKPIPGLKCVDEDVGPLRGVDCNIPHRPGEWILTRHFESSLASESSQGQSIPRIGDPLGSSRLSSQKQNREGVAEAQNGQYRATTESSPECGGGPGRV
ncbi:hypothetical protein DVH24_032251 [Malus domestica]|uniref:Uncharacterized protein n=1 Tax=Malus domestica TaxID=3750 RepID=A0A498J6M3_MALDO|nr:hypothetical protein DVH24_032251 [Malus domestica]